MKYEVIKSKDKTYRKYGLNYSTILYELENSPDISELYLHQEKFLDNLLSKADDNNLYALVSCFYGKENNDSSNEYKLWKGFLPVEGEDFNLIENAVFESIIFEQQIVGSECVLWNGIAKISPKFYAKNYMFFNYQPMRFLLVATVTQVEEIKKNINKHLTALVEKKFPFGDYKKQLLCLLRETDCILIEAQDDAHAGSFLCYVSQNSKHIEILESIIEEVKESN